MDVTFFYVSVSTAPPSCQQMLGLFVLIVTFTHSNNLTEVIKGRDQVKARLSSQIWLKIYDSIHQLFLVEKNY